MYILYIPSAFSEYMYVVDTEQILVELNLKKVSAFQVLHMVCSEA